MWTDFSKPMSRAFVDAFERNVDAQSRFLDTWLAALDDTPMDETMKDGTEGYVRAYQVWMRAAEEQAERLSDAMEGEDVELEDFRDIWLNASNEAFKEMMGTTAFALATGQTVDNALGAKEGLDEVTETTLHAYGFATEGDIEEVGKRLVELERRQHAVEEKLDRILEAVEE